MRKILAMLLTVIAMMLTACGVDSAKSDEQTAEAAKNSTLVAYFSCTGNTKTLAQNAAIVLNADMFEIKPKVPYTEADLDWHNDMSRSTIEMNDDSARPEIDGTIENFDQYDTVVIAYPIWWHQAPRIIDTFVESYDWNGKTVLPICTSGGSDVGTSAGYIANLAKGGDWKEGHCFFNQTEAGEVQKWAAGL